MTRFRSIYFKRREGLVAEHAEGALAGFMAVFLAQIGGKSM